MIADKSGQQQACAHVEKHLDPADRLVVHHPEDRENGGHEQWISRHANQGELEGIVESVSVMHKEVLGKGGVGQTVAIEFLITDRPGNAQRKACGKGENQAQNAFAA